MTPSVINSDEILAAGRKVLKTEADALWQLGDSISGQFVAACETLFNAKGRIITSGMGKSGHIARKIAATLASTGTPAHYIHPAEASHGDLGMVMKDDVCLIISNSGETAELSDLIAHTKRFSIPLIGIASRENSSLIKASDVGLILPDAPEACAIGMAPTTSTTMALALGDALCVAVMQMRGFLPEHFHAFHPGGKLGAQLMRVDQLMHQGDSLPLASPDSPMSDVILTMTAKAFGVVGIVVQNRLVGVITDGDLRRHMDGLMQKVASDVMNPNPRTIAPDHLAAEALGLMNTRKITVLFAVDEAQKPVGLLHLHDCLRAGIR